MESVHLEKNNNNPNFNKVVSGFNHKHLEGDMGKGNMLVSSHKASESEYDRDIITSNFERVTSPVYIAQQNMNRSEGEHSYDKPSDTDSEPDTDMYSFTEDQKRAMMELMAQKQEDAELLDEEPPEYNVKGRLEQLNAELANDPTPLRRDREHRVGFKKQIVDLVAPPPPDYSDDESQANNSTKGDTQVNNSIQGGTQANNSIKGDTQTNNSIMGDTQANNSIKGDTQSNNSIKGDTQANNSIKGDTQANNSIMGDTQANNSIKGDTQTNNSIKGDTQANNSIKEEPLKSPLITVQNRSQINTNNEKHSNKENVSAAEKRQFVVERDGQFSVLSATELSTSERKMLLNKVITDKKTEKQSEHLKEKKTEKQNENELIKNKNLSNRAQSAGKVDTGHAVLQVLPKPPSKPRPNTATSGLRRNYYLSQTHSKSSDHSSFSFSSLDNFHYNSPYAMTPEQKDEARERARRMEEERKEKEMKYKEEVEEKKRENDLAFQAWLLKKHDKDKKRQGAEGDKLKSGQEHKEENEEAYKAWLREKKAQVKKEKLLKRRQQQERAEGSFLRSTEECEEAFNEWLKKKNAASKKKNSNDKQTDKLHRIQSRKSRKLHALIRALKDSHMSPYTSSYNYRF